MKVKKNNIEKYQDGTYLYSIYKMERDLAYKNRKEIEPSCVLASIQDIEYKRIETFDNEEEAEKRFFSDDYKPDVTRYESYYGGERFRVTEFYLAEDKVMDGKLEEDIDKGFDLREDWYYDIDDDEIKYVTEINLNKLKKYLYSILEIKEMEEIEDLNYFFNYVVYFNDPKIRKMYTEDAHYLAGNIEVSIGLKDYEHLEIETRDLCALIHLDKIYDKYIPKDNINLTRKLITIVEGIFNFTLEYLI